MTAIISAPSTRMRVLEYIEALRQKYGDAFKTGLCINLTLQEALSIIHRERKRIDAYSGLVSYLKRELGITLTITSQKTKPKSL